MKTYHFIRKDLDDQPDLPGFTDVRRKNFDPATGIGVAHDILEHFDDDDDDIAGELKAHGAMLWIRGRNGGFENNFFGVEFLLSGEFVSIMEHWLQEGMTLRWPPRTRKPADEYDHILLEKTLVQGTKDLMRSGHEYTMEQVQEFIECARGWMRIGISKAKKRYRKSDGYEICQAFKEIAKNVDYWVRRTAIGDKLSVSIEPYPGGGYRIETSVRRRGRIVKDYYYAYRNKYDYLNTLSR